MTLAWHLRELAQKGIRGQQNDIEVPNGKST